MSCERGSTSAHQPTTRTMLSPCDFAKRKAGGGAAEIPMYTVNSVIRVSFMFASAPEWSFNCMLVLEDLLHPLLV